MRETLRRFLILSVFIFASIAIIIIANAYGSSRVYLDLFILIMGTNIAFAMNDLNEAIQRREKWKYKKTLKSE